MDQAVTDIVRAHWGRLLAALVKQFGDLQLAEDCLQDAAVAALTHWPKAMPEAPDAWLLTAARRRGLDQIKRKQTQTRHAPALSFFIENQMPAREEGPMHIPDKRLEMLFTCCHPALDEKTQTALTLRTLGGLSADEIAHAYLDKPATMAQRLSRARSKIKLAGIPYEIPAPDALPARASAVMRVIYLIFNAGYHASIGDDMQRPDLMAEAVRLGTVLCDLMPHSAEAAGLLALMLLHQARAGARMDAAGAMVALEAQDRSLWDAAQIAQADQLLQKALSQGPAGPYQLQAAIAAIHAQSPSWTATDWPQIAGLYAHLMRLQPSPVIWLNAAVAVSYAQTPRAALDMLDDIADALADYSHYHAARADFLARDGHMQAAADCFQIAINLTQNTADQAFLRDKLARLRPQ